MSIKANTFSAVTTFNLKKHPYGLEMINSFFVNWPDEIKLTAFIENATSIDDSLVKHKIVIKEYHQHIPDYNKFLKKYKEKRHILMISVSMYLDLLTKYMLFQQH